MKKFSSIILLLTAQFCLQNNRVNAQTTIDTLNATKVLDLVANKSKEINISSSTLHLAATAVKDKKASQLPAFSVFAEIDKASNMPVYSNGLFHTPEQHDVVHTLYQTGANLYFNLYSGLKTKRQIELAEIDAELTGAQHDKQVALIKLKALHLFYDLYLQRAWIDIMQADINEKQEQATEIKHLFDKGVVLESDVIRAELEISNRKMTLLEIKNDVQILNQQLNVLIGKADNDVVVPDVVLETSMPIEDVNSIMASGEKNAFDEKISHFHVEAAEQKIGLAKSDNSFQLGVVGSFQFSNPQIFLYPYNTDWYNLGIVGLKASYNISSIYHNKHKVSAAKIEAHEAHIHHEKVKDDIRTALFEAYHNYQEAQEYIGLRSQQVQYATENARIIKNAYFSQTALITDLLDANVTLLKAQFELKQARINVFKTYYSLAFAQGNL